MGVTDYVARYPKRLSSRITLALFGISNQGGIINHYLPFYSEHLLFHLVKPNHPLLNSLPVMPFLLLFYICPRFRLTTQLLVLCCFSNQSFLQLQSHTSDFPIF